MSSSIPFDQETFRPLCIKGNDTAEHPTEFEISAVGGTSRARLRSILAATSGLAADGEWGPETQRAVIAAFETGPGVFAEGISKVHNLTVPAALALKVGILSKIPDKMDPKSPIPISTGYEYARVCGFWPLLSFEIAMALARISGQADIDPRFFDWLSTLAGMPEILPGTAALVGRKRARRGTAGSRKAAK